MIHSVVVTGCEMVSFKEYDKGCWKVLFHELRASGGVEYEMNSEEFNKFISNMD